MCTNQKAEPRPGPAQTEGQSPVSRVRPKGFLVDQDQHRPRGRPLFPRQTGTSTDRVAAHLSQNGMSHPLGPFRGNTGEMGAFGGPFLPGAEPSVPGRQAEQAFSQSAVTNPVGQGRPGPARPGPARTEGQSALSRQAEWAFFPRYGKHWCGMIVPQFTQIHHWLPPLFPVTKCPQWTNVRPVNSIGSCRNLVCALFLMQ